MAPESPNFYNKGDQIDFDFKAVDSSNSMAEEKVPNAHERLISMLQEFFKNKEKPGTFNILEILRNYDKGRDEYFKEKKTRERNPGYQRTGWEKIMANHTPSIFTPEDWLSFVGKHREELSKIIDEPK